MPKLLLEAFKGKNKRVPVWLMRQAGRYLPEYQAIKKNHSLMDMFRTPDIAAEITLQPVRRLGVDAAILFADILTLPSAMGFQVDFVDGKGPVIANPIQSAADIDRFHDYKDLNYVAGTVQRVAKSLPLETALIGFAGSPFTVLTYLIQAQGPAGINKALRFALAEPKAYHQMMERLTSNTIRYIDLQRQAGIEAFQLFDTWAGVLRPQDYRTYVLPYVHKIFKSCDLPSIYYLKNSAHLLAEMERSGAQVLSVCETVAIGHHPVLNRTKKGVQGNLFNGLLYQSDDVLVKETRALLRAAKRTHGKYIFNLSHGMLPDMSPDKVRIIIQEVKKFKW